MTARRLRLAEPPTVPPYDRLPCSRTLSGFHVYDARKQGRGVCDAYAHGDIADALEAARRRVALENKQAATMKQVWRIERQARRAS